MRIGVSTWAWSYPFASPRDIALVGRMSALGADHFELGGEAADHPDALDAVGLRQQLETHGMTASVCGLFSSERDLSSLDRAIRAAGMDHLKACVDLAARIGARTVVGAVCGAGGSRMVPPDERARRVRLASLELRSVGDYAQAAGVRIGVEALNRYENDFLNVIEQSEPIIDEADHPNIGFHLDLFHASIEEADIAAAIRRAGRRLLHCHAVDTNRLPPGAGHADWASILGALVAIDYDGALVIETFDPDNALLAPLAGFWRPLPRPQDDLVRDGIAFLARETDGARQRRSLANGG